MLSRLFDLITTVKKPYHHLHLTSGATGMVAQVYQSVEWCMCSTLKTRIEPKDKK